MLDRPEFSAAKARSPLEEVVEQTERVAQICDLLEAMADDLPRRSVPVWRTATRMCHEVVALHYKFILVSLMPILKRRMKGEVDCEDMLTQLEADFKDESGRLAELNVLLSDAVGEDTEKIGSEALGYALRCFFGSIRRNTVWESEVLLPMAMRRLTPKDLDELAVSLQSSKEKYLH